MAVRTTEALVGALLVDSSTHPKGRGDWDGVTDLDQFISAATVIVDRVVTCATAKSITLTDTELELIERWLSAHCYVQNDQTLASKSTGGASGSAHGQTGLNLDSSRYGQMAKTLDYSGCLAAIDKRAVARLNWVGKRPSAQTPYVERD